MKLHPLHSNVVVKPLEADETTPSGIVLPETVDKDKPEQGEVIAIGPGKILENGEKATMSVKVGDKVVFKKYSPDEIKVDQEKYLIISDSDILAIIE
ncbi:MAG: co-chaperone GroES [Candidatus Pacebacteria bacterium]|nr:co-chaperone GroES [Candidatus Paceibacterota bacterium]